MASAQVDGAQIILLDRSQHAVSGIVDGNLVQVAVSYNQPVDQTALVEFFLEGADQPVGSCTIETGERSCQTQPFPAYGWYWRDDGGAMPRRTLSAHRNGEEFANLELAIEPRPVVMVHGFNSSWRAWQTYLGAGGFLQERGLSGFAVGDGQVDGVLNTGGLLDPFGRTNSIAENAEIVGQYIRDVKALTGAEQVDLVVHSMGGMISRYYLARVMEDRDVSQLIILGTPMAGTSCSILPAALGILLPATIEIQPAYMEGIFNQQIYQRKGVPFSALAGTAIISAVQSPCTAVPSDLIVPVNSVRAIPMDIEEIPLLHTDLNTSKTVFDRFVLVRLATPPSGTWTVADPAPGSSAVSKTQFSRTYTGHINPGETVDVVIPIDPNVTVANFALLDTSRSLTIQVTGASGNVIQLDPVANGEVRIEDPESMLYLGYGFQQPKAGRWVVTLQTTEDTPPGGADYAVMAQFDGGAKLSAAVDNLVPEQNQTVEITAELVGLGEAPQLLTALASIRKPDGTLVSAEMARNGSTASLTIRPDEGGIYNLEVSVIAQLADGLLIDRAVMVPFIVQQNEEQIAQVQWVALLLAVVLIVLFLFLWMRRRKRK